MQVIVLLTVLPGTMRGIIKYGIRREPVPTLAEVWNHSPFKFKSGK